MRPLAALFCALILALSPLGASADVDKDAAYYFYENYCESCDPRADFLEEYEMLTDAPLTAPLYAHNTVTAAGRAALAEICTLYGLESPALPLAIVDGEVYEGLVDIQTRLPETALAQYDSTDSVIYYLYVPACESCARAVAAIEALPESATIRRGLYRFESRVVVEKIDLSQRAAEGLALMDRLGVPEDERVAPMVILRDSYLSGADAIEQSLGYRVLAGRAVGNAPPGAENSADAIAWPLGGAVLAGLVAGLNPCALSMLLLLLGTLIGARRRAAPCAIAFLAAKLLSYMLIGTLLLAVFQRFNPSWLMPVSRVLVTLLGGALAAMNLMDAYRARRGELGKIRNQLPEGMRRFLRGAIGKNGGRAIPFFALLGVLVAGGEFLCAGQVYLMGLLAALQTGADTARMLGLLFAYCGAFILPSAILTAIVLRARGAMEASGFFARHMAAVKLITALAMLALIAVAWLV